MLIANWRTKCIRTFRPTHHRTTHQEIDRLLMSHSNIVYLWDFRHDIVILKLLEGLRDVSR